MVFQVVTHINVVALLLMGNFWCGGGVVKVIASLLKTKHEALFPYRGYFLRSKGGLSVSLEFWTSWMMELCCLWKQSLPRAAEGFRTGGLGKVWGADSGMAFLLSPSPSSLRTWDVRREVKSL